MAWYQYAASVNSDFCKSSAETFNELIHPLVSQIEALDLERLRKFDLEDFDGYMEFVVKDTDSDFGNFLYRI